MKISNTLVKDFCRVSSFDKNLPDERHGYGIAFVENDVVCVKLDGSETKTPADTLVDVRSGDKVSVMIKNHTVTITGNFSRPTSDSMTAASVTVLPEKDPELSDNLFVVNRGVKSRVTIEDLQEFIGGTMDYEELNNKPSIEGVTLSGDKSFEDLMLEPLTNIELEDLLT